MSPLLWGPRPKLRAAHAQRRGARPLAGAGWAGPGGGDKAGGGPRAGSGGGCCLRSREGGGGAAPARDPGVREPNPRRLRGRSGSVNTRGLGGPDRTGRGSSFQRDRPRFSCPGNAFSARSEGGAGDTPGRRRVFAALPLLAAREERLPLGLPQQLLQHLLAQVQGAGHVEAAWGGTSRVQGADQTKRDSEGPRVPPPLMAGRTPSKSSQAGLGPAGP